MAEFDVHPDMRDLLAAKEAVPTSSDPLTQRAGWNNYGASMSRPYPDGMQVNDTLLGVIPVRFYRPKGVTAPAPCVIYLHGGAFVKGSLDSGDQVAWGIADQVGAVVMSVDYRLAPEHPFPAGPEDCYTAIKDLSAQAAKHGIDPDRIGVWGDSAGGCMAAAVCLMARDRGGPKIRAQALNYAVLTDEVTSNSYRVYADSPGVKAANLDRCLGLYLGKDRPTTNPYAAPLKAKDLSNLPPAHVHYAEIDPLADESIAYAERLKAAGNKVVLRCAKRMIHGYLRARFTGPDAAAEYAAPCNFLRAELVG